jgi:AcrR family transcriptional regulator
MSVRERVLDAVQDLVLAGDAAPTLDAVAAAAGVSKGGLLHHFRDRRALTHGLILRAVACTDVVMTEAARTGAATETWLRASALSGVEQDVAGALLALARLSAGGRLDLPQEVATAVGRWAEMIEAEVGDPVHADVIRLTGDGLFLDALRGDPPTAKRVDGLVAHLLGSNS